MISRSGVLTSFVLIAVSLLIGDTKGFSNSVARSNQQSQHILSSSVLNEFSIAETELSLLKRKAKRVTASPESTYGKNNADELVNPATQKATIENEFPKRRITAKVRDTGMDSMKHYIKSMCNHDLLNKNEEIILAREIQILLKWEKQREKLEEELLR